MKLTKYELNVEKDIKDAFRFKNKRKLKKVVFWKHDKETMQFLGIWIFAYCQFFYLLLQVNDSKKMFFLLIALIFFTMVFEHIPIGREVYWVIDKK